MEIVERALIHDAERASDAERAACFTSLHRLSSGSILCSCQLGPTKNSPDSTLGIFRSYNQGRTWSRIPYEFSTRVGDVPGSLSCGELVEVAPGHLLLFATWFDRSDRFRPLFDPQTEGLLRSKQIVAKSRDDGFSWSDWQELDTADLRGCATTGPVVVLDDGTLVYAFESFKEFDDPSPKRHGAWIVTSSDQGRTFSPPQLLARDPRGEVYYWDQRLCAGGRGGELIALFWTHDLRQKRDLQVHLRRARWSTELQCDPLQSTPIRGQIAAPWLLPDGRLLAFVVDRAGPCTMKLWRSPDGGTSWPESDCLLIHTHEERAALSQGTVDIDFKKYWEDMGKWSFGHPAICGLGDDQVLVAYYAGHAERLSVHCARVEMKSEE